MTKNFVTAGLALAMMTGGLKAQDILIPEGDTVTTTQVLNNAGDTATVLGTIEIAGAGNGISGANGMNTVLVGSTGIVDTETNDNGFSAIFLDADGNIVTVQSGGLVDGGSDGVVVGANGQITNAGTIIGDVQGIQANGDNLVVNNQAGGLIQGDFDDGILGSSMTVNNAGTIQTLGTGNGDNGISATGDAMITNQSGGTISSVGGDGIIVSGANLTLDNSGNILSAGGGDGDSGVSVTGDATITNQTGGMITSNQGDAILVTGNLIQLNNSGMIQSNGTGGGDHGVAVTEDATINNLTGGSIISTEGDAINIGGDGTIDNSGTIQSNGTGTGDSAIAISNNGTVTNRAGATILGTTGNGVGIGNDALSVVNETGATITGLNGVVADDIVSLTNDGLIQGTDPGFGDGVEALGGGASDDITLLNNTANGRIIGAQNGVNTDDGIIVELNNQGSITGTANHGVAGENIVALTNTGTISGAVNGVDASGDGDNEITTLINQSGGTIMGGTNALNASDDIGAVTNMSGATIMSTTGDAIDAGGDIGTVINSGLIQSTNLDGVNSGDELTLLENRAGGVIMAGDDAVSFDDAELATTIINNGTLIGGDKAINGSEGTTITNGVTGVMTGTNGPAIDLDAGETGDSTVNNRGQINSGAAQQAILFAEGDDTLNNNSGLIFNNGSSSVVDFAGGNDTWTDTSGEYRNDGGTTVVFLGPGADVANLTGTRVTRPGADITQNAINLGSGVDQMNITGFANINGTFTGGIGQDDLCMELWGVTAAQVVAASTEGTAMDNGDGTVTLSDAGTLDFGETVYRWTSFQGSAVVKTVVLSQLNGLTPNQQAIGSALDQAFQGSPGSDMEFVLIEIVGQGTGAFPNIANQLSPQSIGESFRRTGINNASFFRRSLDNQIDTLFVDGFESGDSNAWSTSGVNFNATGFELIDPTQDLKTQRWDRRLASLGLSSGVMSDVPGAAFGGFDLASTDYDAKSMDDSKKMIEAPLDDPRRFGVWLAGQGILADVDQADGDVQDFDYDTAAVTVGFDYKVTREIVVGVLFNYGNTDANIDGRGSSQEIDTYSGGAYVGWKSLDDGWFANGFVSGGASEYDQSRRITFGGINRTAYSNPEGYQLTTGASSGYLFDLNREGTWTAGPIWGLQYTHLQMDSFTETGAGSLNLNVGEQEVDSLRSALGAKVQGRWQLTEEVALLPTLTAEWLHEFLDDSTGITGAFSDPAPGSFIVNTQDPDRDYGLVGVSMTALIGEEWSAFLAYDAQFNSEYLGHGISGGARFEF